MATGSRGGTYLPVEVNVGRGVTEDQAYALARAHQKDKFREVNVNRPAPDDSADAGWIVGWKGVGGDPNATPVAAQAFPEIDALSQDLFKSGEVTIIAADLPPGAPDHIYVEPKVTKNCVCAEFVRMNWARANTAAI